MRTWPLSIAVVLILAAIAAAPVAEQSQAQVVETCPQLVDRAFSEVGTNCANMESNTACYGFSLVKDVVFAEPLRADRFDTPGERTALVTVEALSTTDLNTERAEWGIAVVRVQGNIPLAWPHQPGQMVYIAVGDVQLENNVDPEGALLFDKVVEILTARQTDLRDAPRASAKIVGTLAAHTPLEADGISPDGKWVRVLHLQGPAWVSLRTLDPDANVKALPVITEESRGPMQDFHVITGTGSPACSEALPSVLIVDTPEGGPVTDITANDLEMRLATETCNTTIFLRTTPDRNILQIVVGRGLVTLNPDTRDAIEMTTAYSVSLPLNEEGNIDLERIDWDDVEPRLLTQEEIDLFKPFERFPRNVKSSCRYTSPIIIRPSGIGEVIPTVIAP